MGRFFKFDEDLVRKVIVALHCRAFPWYFNPETVPFNEAFTGQDWFLGTELYSLTEGPGRHAAGKQWLLEWYEIPEGYVCATIAKKGFFRSKTNTYLLAKDEDRLKLVTIIKHTLVP